MRTGLKTRIVLYFVVCILLAFGSPIWAKLLKLGNEPARAWCMAASALAAIVFLWAALRSLSRLQASNDSPAAH